MLWSEFYNKFKNEYIRELKGTAFVYVISQFQGRGPYKIGLTKYDLYRRFSNYQTSFVDFDILYLIMMPYKKESKLESILHKDIELSKFRIQFPKKKPDGRVVMSEWFQKEDQKLDPKTIEYALRRAFKNNNGLDAIFGYDLTTSKIVDMSEYHMDGGDAGFGWYTSKKGTIHKLSKKGSDQYNQQYFDNNRLWEGIDYSMQPKQKKQKTVVNYIGTELKSEDDVGKIVEVFKKKNKKYVKIKWSKLVGDKKGNYHTTNTLANVKKFLIEFGN